MSNDSASQSRATDSQETPLQRSDGVDQSADSDTTEQLRDEVRRLENRNRRLQERYESTQQSRSRQTVFGLAAVGVLAGVSGYLVPNAQEVLFTIAATGLFAAVLSYTLTPDRFVPVDIGEGIYESLSMNEQAVADDLGLSEIRVYVPTDAGGRLFVPEIEAYDKALVRTDVDADSEDGANDRLVDPFVVSDLASESGLSLRPTASTLLSSFTEQHGNTLPADPTAAAMALQEGVTDVLELARDARTDVDTANGRVTFEVRGQLFGPLTRFDHPVASFLGMGLAEALSKPVELSVEETDEGSFVTCRWPSSSDADVDTDTDGQ